MTSAGDPFFFKFKASDDVILVQKIKADIKLGTAGKVIGRAIFYDHGVVKEYSVEFDGREGWFSLREHHIDHNTALDRLIRDW